MALTYDLEKDIRFKQGQEEKAALGIKVLLQLNLSHQQIADSMEITLEFVRKVADSLKK